MRKLIIIWISIISSSVFSQTTIESILNKYNDKSVPYIHTESLKERAGEALILDSREKKEFEVSHLRNAQYIGFEEFDNLVLEKLSSDLSADKNRLIVVYCSI